MPLRLKILLVAIFIFSASPVLAQTDDEARQIVLQAVENLAAGYHVTEDANVTQWFTSPDSSFEIKNRLSLEGDVAANGDYFFTISRTVETEDAPENTPPLKIELVSVDGVLYINFQTADTIYEEEYLDFAPGWHRYDELAEDLSDPVNGAVLQLLVNVQLPTELSLADNRIESVVEVEGETLDGVEMRVFDVEMNALEVLGDQSQLSGEKALEELLRNAAFISKVELNLTYRLWIGAEDGQLYQVTGESRTYLPYLTEEQEDGLSYDLETTSGAVFTISQHGAVDEITLPEDVPQS